MKDLIIVATMYVDTSHITRGGKTYTRHLLRESYRANGKVLHRTLANVSHCSAAEIEAIRLALRQKEELEHLGTSRMRLRCSKGRLLVRCGRFTTSPDAWESPKRWARHATGNWRYGK